MGKTDKGISRLFNRIPSHLIKKGVLAKKSQLNVASRDKHMHDEVNTARAHLPFSDGVLE